MEKQRIQFYTDPETKRRIEVAAAKYNIPVSEYCLHAVRLQLEDDELQGEDQMDTYTLDETYIDTLRALQEQIKQERGGELIDIDRFIEEMREERDREISGLP